MSPSVTLSHNCGDKDTNGKYRLIHDLAYVVNFTQHKLIRVFDYKQLPPKTINPKSKELLRENSIQNRFCGNESQFKTNNNLIIYSFNLN